MTVKFSSFIASASLLLFCTVSAAAFADGMPFEAAKPKQNLTPIDKSLTAPPPAAVAAPPVTPPVPEVRTVEVQPENTSFFGLSVGLYNSLTHSNAAVAFNAEWQPGTKIVGRLQPLFGAMATTKGAMLGYAGIGVPFDLTDHVFLMPSLSFGAYRAGDDYDLHRHIVARPGIELAYKFDDKSRLGLNFDVLSNMRSPQARDRSEMIALTYTMPLNALGGGTLHTDTKESSTTTTSVTARPVAEPEEDDEADMAPVVKPTKAKTVAPAKAAHKAAPVKAAPVATPAEETDSEPAPAFVAPVPTSKKQPDNELP